MEKVKMFSSTHSPVSSINYKVEVHWVEVYMYDKEGHWEFTACSFIWLQCESLGFAEGVITKLLKRALNNRKRSDKAENTKFGISRENNIKNVHFAVQINWWGRYMCTSIYAPMTPYKTSQIGFDHGPICPLK